MIDIHTHIVPFVDDGSKSLEDSIEMVKRDISFGVKTIIATPHHIRHRYEKSVEELKENFNLLNDKVKELGLDVNLILGQEICFSSRENIIEKLNNKELLTLGDSNYILLEFSFDHEPEDLSEVLYSIRSNNYEIIVAHVERYNWITLDKVYEMRAEGAYIQVNANAICGLTSGKEKRFVKKLLKKGLVDIVASDMHSFRPSNLDKALAKTKNPDLFEFDF